MPAGELAGIAEGQVHEGNGVNAMRGIIQWVIRRQGRVGRTWGRRPTSQSEAGVVQNRALGPVSGGDAMSNQLAEQRINRKCNPTEWLTSKNKKGKVDHDEQ